MLLVVPQTGTIKWWIEGQAVQGDAETLEQQAMQKHVVDTRCASALMVLSAMNATLP